MWKLSDAIKWLLLVAFLSHILFHLATLDKDGYRETRESDVAQPERTEWHEARAK